VKIKRINCKRNPSRKCFVIIHGSGGLGTDTDRMFEFCKKNGYDVLYMDHFEPRKITKIFYSNNDLIRPDYFDLAQDWSAYVDKELFGSFDEVNLVGFSLGANAALILNDARFFKCFAFYPSYAPASESLLKAFTENVTFFFGSLDIWTPSSTVLKFQKEGRIFGKTVVYDGAYHGFFRKKYFSQNGVLPLGKIEHLNDLVLSDQDYREQFQWENPFVDYEAFPQKELVMVKSCEASSRNSLDCISKELGLPNKLSSFEKIDSYIRKFFSINLKNNN
jgi:dienelactone hydrolase